jgi:ribokinase
VGSLNVDRPWRVPRHPDVGETIVGDQLAPLPGGKGLNQAIAAARDGADARFVGCVGQDEQGDLLRMALITAGVNVAGLRGVDMPSGLACVCVDAAGENQIAVSPGANLAVRAAQLPELRDDSILLMQMEVPPEENARAIARARQAGARVLLNLAPAAAMDRAALGGVDLLIMNESEAAWLGRQLGRTGDAAALHEVLGIGIAVTLGGQGAAVVTAAGGFELPAFAVEVVDSTGAGDAWCGALAAALHLGMPLELAVRRANAAGALACTKPGAAPAMPDSAAIDALMGLD